MTCLLRILRFVSWLLVAAWISTIFYLSSLSNEELQEMAPTPVWDKLAHGLAFSGGGFLLAWAFRLSTRWRIRRIILFAAVGISLYGAFDEWRQQFTPGRSAKDVGDWTADTIGGCFGALAAAITFTQKKAQRLRPS